LRLGCARICIFSFACGAVPRQLRSFPTRRSSDLPDTVRRHPAKSTKNHLPLVVHLVVTDRPGFAGKTTMLTYIQINAAKPRAKRSEEHTSELQSREYLVCRLLLEKNKDFFILFLK